MTIRVRVCVPAQLGGMDPAAPGAIALRSTIPVGGIDHAHAIPRSLVALAAAVGLTAPQALHAQTYPARSVTLVVPSAAGGGTDTIARLIGDQLSKQLGQGFVVENRTGAGMLVGTTAVAKARRTVTRCWSGSTATCRSIRACSPSCRTIRSPTSCRWRCSRTIRFWWW